MVTFKVNYPEQLHSIKDNQATFCLASESIIINITTSQSSVAPRFFPQSSINIS